MTVTESAPGRCASAEGRAPLAVVVYRDDLDVREPGAHAGTFRGNQLAMAAGTATLAHVRESRLVERAVSLGVHMLAQLRGLAGHFPCIGEVRGRGLMIGLELVNPEGAPEWDRGGGAGLPHVREPRPPAPELAATVQQERLWRGLIVELGDRHASVVRLLPLLTITDEQVAAVLGRLADAVEAAARSHTGRGGQERRTSRRQPSPTGRPEGAGYQPRPRPSTDAARGEQARRRRRRRHQHRSAARTEAAVP